METRTSNNGGCWERNDLKSAVVFLAVVIGIVLFCTLRWCAGLAGPGNADFGFELPGNLEFVRLDSTSRCIIDLEKNFSNTILEPDIRQLGWDENHSLCYVQGTKHRNSIDETGWWIITISPREVIGPLDYSEYEDKRVELGVSPTNVAVSVLRYNRDGSLKGP